jgi:hypothetical protein
MDSYTISNRGRKASWRFGGAATTKTLPHVNVAVEPVAAAVLVKAGIPVKRQVQAELARLGCALQFVTNVGIAVVAVMMRSK